MEKKVVYFAKTRPVPYCPVSKGAWNLPEWDRCYLCHVDKCSEYSDGVRRVVVDERSMEILERLVARGEIRIINAKMEDDKIWQLSIQEKH